jgi:hypothetical protein
MLMRKFLPLTVLLTPAIGPAHEADNSAVQWNQIVGVITAPGINNPVGGINAGTGPCSVHEGHAHVNLASGEASFEVHGLVLNGSNASGTPGPVTTVTGTLVCNPGTDAQAVRDTAEVRLSPQGDAHFRGEITGIPPLCAPLGERGAGEPRFRTTPGLTPPSLIDNARALVGLSGTNSTRRGRPPRPR